VCRPDDFPPYEKATAITPSHRFAIETHFLGPTNTMGARIAAQLGGPRSRVVVPYDHAWGIAENHALAAIALIEELRRRMPYAYADIRLAQGMTKEGYVFVFI